MTTPWTVDMSLVIPHRSEPRLLLLPTENGWELPRFTLMAFFTKLHLLQRAIRERFAAEMTMLRLVNNLSDETQRIFFTTWVMENHTPDWTPPANAQWFDAAALQTLPLANETMRPHLLRTLETLDAPESVERVPWMREGWFADAQAWITETLTEHGYTLVGVPEQFKHFTLSSLLRAETTDGIMYFKAPVALPLFCDEPKMMQTLGALLPQYIPAPLAIDESRRWMLSTDFGETLRDLKPDAVTLERVAQIYADLQIATTSMLDTLLTSGCLDRRLDVLASQIDALLIDEAGVIDLTAEERAAWQSSGDKLKALCEKLAAYNIPYTLVHGDFHAGNVTLRGDDVLFFDWTDACVTHPFFDLPVYINYDVLENVDALRDAYLARWTAYEPMERLREAYDLAVILGSLHQAVSYQSIRANTEPDLRSEWDWGIPKFARVILPKLNPQ